LSANRVKASFDSRDHLVEVQLALGQRELDAGRQSQAFEWFRIAAQGGDARAHNMLGRCFELGWGVATNLGQAHAHYNHAAEKGDAWAMFNLADLLMRAGSGDNNEMKAFTLYTDAACLGHVKSMNMIGLFYEDGRGIEPDREMAQRFFRAGAEGGDCWAAYNCARLALEENDISCAMAMLDICLQTGFAGFWAEIHPPLARHHDARIVSIAQAAAKRYALSGEMAP
jgi:TPR repeat protein